MNLAAIAKIRKAKGASKNAGCKCLMPKTIHDANKVDRKAEIIIHRLRFGSPKDVGRSSIHAPKSSPERGAAMIKMSSGRG